MGDHSLDKAPIVDYGYLTIETYARTLTVTFKTADQTGVAIQGFSRRGSENRKASFEPDVSNS